MTTHGNVYLTPAGRVLLLFRDEQKRSFEEVREALGMGEQTARRALVVLRDAGHVTSHKGAAHWYWEPSVGLSSRLLGALTCEADRRGAGRE